MLEGTLILTISGSADHMDPIICECVPSIEDQVSTSIMRVPIITFRADQAFAYDTGATSSLSFTIVRNNPLQIDDLSRDCRQWSNAYFEKKFTEFIDRWQAETDGCRLQFTPVTSGQRPIDENVYLSSLSFKSDKGHGDTIYINLSVNIGTMTAKIKPSIPVDAPLRGYTDPVYTKDSMVTMTSSDCSAYYVLYYGGSDLTGCVSSYSVKCGPEQPFPSLVMNISKKNLTAVAPDLVGDIIAGKNRVDVYGIGKGQYIVTKVASSGQNFKITAYSIYEQYRASPIATEMSFGSASGVVYKTPMDIILRILTSQAQYGVEGARIFFNTPDIYYCYRTSNDTWGTDSSVFAANSDAWYVLGVCALKLGCKIWFADGKAYIVDFSISANEVSGVTKSSRFDFADFDTFNLNMTEFLPANPTTFDREFAQSICGDTELGDEGADTLKNYTVVVCNGGNQAVTFEADEVTAASRKKFGVKKVEYYVPEVGTTDAGAISYNTNVRYCDTEQSIGFKLAETHYAPPTDPEDPEPDLERRYWQPYFPMLTRVAHINDYSKDLMLSNRSNFKVNGAVIRMLNKLALSTAEYHFPEGYTEYWFGILSPADLTQNTSVINNIVYNG